jgi:hypothetical protein
VVDQSVKFACRLKATDLVCFVCSGGVESSVLLLMPLNGLLYPSGWQWIMSVEQTVWHLAGETVVFGETCPSVLCSPQIPLDPNRAWTWAVEVGSRRLTTWDTARPYRSLVSLQTCLDVSPKFDPNAYQFPGSSKLGRFAKPLLTSARRMGGSECSSWALY